MIEEMNTTNKSTESLVRLNVGSGSNKIEGFINLDGEASCAPDIIHDITKEPLPYADGTVDEIAFFHCIEHLGEQFHDRVLEEFWRALKPDGILLIAYPEFLKCVELYKNNYRGQREFWKKTIYGRQSHPGDFHVTLMDTPFFLNRLRRNGFTVIQAIPEPEPNSYNTVVKVSKGLKYTEREELLREEIFNS